MNYQQPSFPQPPQYPQPPRPSGSSGSRLALVLGISFAVVFVIAGVVAVVAMKGTPVTTASATPAATIPPPAAPAPVLGDALERAVGVSRGVRPQYVVRSEKHLDYRDPKQPGSPLIPRLDVRVSVPRGLPKADLEANLRHALLTAYEKATKGAKLGALTVGAYASEKTDGPYSAGQATFAPGGQWKNADREAPLSSWAVTIELAAGYFEEKPTTPKIGASVVIADENSDTVTVSNKVDRWQDEDVVARVPSGTKAKLLSSKEFPMVGGTSMVRDEVEIARTHKRGWVNGSYVKVE